MHVAFDLDGVLLDSESDLSWLDRALSRTLRAFDLPDTGTNRSKLFPATNPEFERIADDAGVAPRELWDVRDRHYREAKLGAIEGGELRPFPDVDALYDLDGHDLHVISNSPREVVAAFVSTYGYDDLFAARIGRGSAFEDLERLKPHRHFFDELVRHTGEDDAEYAYVGHTETDERFAENAGMGYVHLDRTGGGGLGELGERLG